MVRGGGGGGLRTRQDAQDERAKFQYEQSGGQKNLRVTPSHLFLPLAGFVPEGNPHETVELFADLEVSNRADEDLGSELYEEMI